jgi:hypothetical protein
MGEETREELRKGYRTDETGTVTKWPKSVCYMMATMEAKNITMLLEQPELS